MKATIFASYGVLGYEKRPVYSDTCFASDIWETLDVEIPEEYEPYESINGEHVVKLGSYLYLLNECLTNRGGEPAIQWCEPDGSKHWKMLKVY